MLACRVVRDDCGEVTIWWCYSTVRLFESQALLTTRKCMCSKDLAVLAVGFHILLLIAGKPSYVW